MARGWRLNPPPNWPALPSDLRPTPDWRPDPQWGPAPVGWTLWRRERRGAWLFRHKTTLGLGVGTLVIAGSALAGPAATELIAAGGPPLSGAQATGPEVPDRAAPAPLTSADVRPEPEVEEPVRRPQQSAAASRSRTRPSDDPTTVAVPSPSAVPVLPQPAEPVPQLRALPAPTGSCVPDDQGAIPRPGRDRDGHRDHDHDRQGDVVLVVATVASDTSRDDHDEDRPAWTPCPEPTTSPTGEPPG